MKYACIDLKSFYASVECVERGLDPMKVDLVVSDASRGPGAITLAISPALKNKGVKNRCRLFEIPGNLKYIVAKPRMKLYMEYSAKIYGVYLKFFAKEDIYIYSIDECFINLSPYLKLYKLTPLALIKQVMARIREELGILATAGIGNNLFQAKVALDLRAKHSPDGIGMVDEDNFDGLVANHRPLTDIWGIGKGTASKLARYGVMDLLGVRTLPVEILKKLLGVNYEILLDHAWGKEPTTISEIKAYKPETRSITTSQILCWDYQYYEGWQVIKEMIETLVLEMMAKGLCTQHLSLEIKYSRHDEGRMGVSKKLGETTHSYGLLKSYFKDLYFKNVDPGKRIRQLGIALGQLKPQGLAELNLFAEENTQEDHVQETLLQIKQRFGKNAIFRAASLQQHATALARNKLIGGHNGE